MNEEELVQRSRNGDEEAFGALVKAFKNKVFHLIYGMTRNEAISDDLAQEVFIKAFSGLPKFRGGSRFGTWLYQIAVNHTKDFLRKRPPLKQVPYDEPMAGSPILEDETRTREADAEREKKKRIVREAIAGLPLKCRLILSLRDIQGYSYKEISRMLNISPGTVDSRIHRARKRLKERIEKSAPHKEKGYEMS